MGWVGRWVGTGLSGSRAGGRRATDLFVSLTYPWRGPTMMAPMRAAVPPQQCTIPLPAKSVYLSAHGREGCRKGMVRARRGEGEEEGGQGERGAKCGAVRLRGHARVNEARGFTRDPKDMAAAPGCLGGGRLRLNGKVCSPSTLTRRLRGWRRSGPW